jgi:hypothetical protein
VGSKFMEAYKQWRNGEIKAVEAMRLAGMKKVTFYARVKEIEGR